MIKAYNHVKHVFNKKDKSILYTLDKETLIEALNVGGLMELPIYLGKIDNDFLKHNNFYTKRAMLRHISKSQKD